MTQQEQFLQALQEQAIPGKAASSYRFFKAAKGGYGEGDVFWGLTVPAQRSLCKQYYKLLNLTDLAELLQNEVHEVRLSALMMLVLQYQKTKEARVRNAVAEVYLAHLDYVNNWDLVDASAPYILGDWCLHNGYQKLLELARSSHLWRERVAMLSTFAFIKAGKPEPCLEIAEILLHHKHDLIHKAVGWMLRELGNRDYSTEYDFLAKHYKTMPRTMLRYAIEKFDESIRQLFLKGSI